ncbi:Gp49 family protein [uncultured Haemophilus sp.]|uniref:Gp49 family protein n=1 Tax=uncultured Haemophilus sp. TaxID=237779 RepID=UPI002589275F|nr:Gp49 family protein [uncultured Haemophilus sp.]
MNKLTIEYLTELVDDVEYVHQGLLTICTITLKNGYKLAGTSACIDNQNYDPLIGNNCAFANALDKLWELESYLLKQKIYESQNNKVTLRNGNQGEVVYTSQFGKLLIVEHNGDELPPSHWHNADGTFYADAQSPLDVVDIN